MEKPTMKVSDLMATVVEFLDPAASAQDAAALMGELDVGALPIGSAENLQAIITDRDILYRLVAEGKDPRRTPALQIGSKHIFSCRPDDALGAAMDLMASQSIRRLPVVDEAQRVVGWITLSDLSRHLLVDSELVQQALKELTDKVGNT
jgi:CBS domain-containing protein